MPDENVAKASQLRQLPGVDRVLSHLEPSPLAQGLPRKLLVRSIQETLEALRKEGADGDSPSFSSDDLFADILSDLGPAVAGSIGIAPSANINPQREYPSMFEPVHGSAPDIAGRGIANPIGTIWAGAMMMQHLGYPMLHDTLMEAIETVLRDPMNLTPDMGGNAGTRELGQAVLAAMAA